MDEFAMGSASNTGHFGSVINPWRDATSPDTPLTAGGLVRGFGSGGCGAHRLRRARLRHGRFHTPTRQPCAASSASSPPTGDARDTAWSPSRPPSTKQAHSPRCVKDAALILNAICGYDKNDTTTSQQDVPDLDAGYRQRRQRDCESVIPKEYHHDKVAPAILAAWQQAQDMLVRAGAQLVDVSLPHYSLCVARLLYHRPRRSLLKLGTL